MSNSPEHTSSQNRQSDSSGQPEAIKQAMQYPLEQSVQFQTDAARLFLNGLELTDWAQSRGVDLTRQLFSNYIQTLEETAEQTETMAQEGFETMQRTGQQVGRVAQQTDQTVRQGLQTDQQPPAQRTQSGYGQQHEAPPHPAPSHRTTPQSGVPQQRPQQQFPQQQPQYPQQPPQQPPQQQVTLPAEQQTPEQQPPQRAPDQQVPQQTTTGQGTTAGQESGETATESQPQPASQQ